MLQIRVHHDEHRRGARQHAFDARRREPATPDPLDAPDPAVAGADRLDLGAGSIGESSSTKIISGDAAERAIDPRDELTDVLSFVERRHDHRHLEWHGWAASIRVTSAGRLSGGGATAAGPRAIEGPGSFFSILSSDRIITPAQNHSKGSIRSLPLSGGCAAAVN